MHPFVLSAVQVLMESVGVRPMCTHMLRRQWLALCLCMQVAALSAMGGLYADIFMDGPRQQWTVGDVEHNPVGTEGVVHSLEEEKAFPTPQVSGCSVAGVSQVWDGHRGAH